MQLIHMLKLADLPFLLKGVALFNIFKYRVRRAS